MANFIRRLFCINREALDNENDDTLISKTPTLDKLLELETAINSRFESLELKFDKNLEKTQQNTLNVVANVPLSIELINNKLDLLQKKLQEVEEKVDKTLELAEKKSILEEKNNIDEVIENDTKEVNTAGVGANIKEETNSNTDPFKNVTVGASWKEQRFLTKEYKNLYPLDHPSLQHVEVKRDGEKLIYLRMNIAVRATDYATILLSPVQNPGHDDHVFEIVLGHQHVKLSNTTKPGWGREKYILEEGTTALPKNKFGLFYLLIENGTIKFWSDNPQFTGHYRPYFTFEDENLSAINYFGFQLFPQYEHMFIFDSNYSFEGALLPKHR